MDNFASSYIQELNILAFTLLWGLIVFCKGESQQNYQTLHLLTEFIGVLAGQLKAVENSFKFERVPITLF